MATICFVAGLMLMPVETRSTGEALQTFKLAIPSSTLVIVGALLAFAGVAVLIILFLLEHKRSSKSR